MDKKAFLLLVMIVCGCIGNYLLITTYTNDIERGKNMTVDQIQFESTKFDYFKGTWLIFHGLFFVFLLVFLDTPTFKSIYRRFKTDCIKKWQDR